MVFECRDKNRTPKQRPSSKLFDELQELFWMSLFFVRWQIMFGPMLGFGGVFLLYAFVRYVVQLLLYLLSEMQHSRMETL